uniref:Transient receptor potential cation channel subfamily M member 2 n=1 Tax=Latimeria chalumnae TaxID=7897 RepID=H3B0C1_LATCH
VCVCGYPRKGHSEIALSHNFLQDEKWDKQKHTVEISTDAFGDITFIGLGQKVGKYVRVSTETHPHILYELMTKHWGLNIPNLLISVTGGAKNFSMKPRLKDIFRRGLIKAAQSTGAWIITGGSNAGVMKHVGKAIRDYTMGSCSKDGKIVAIGIATWGTVYNRESLLSKEEKFPAEYVLDDENQGRLSCLDNNHSHFILVDDGTHGNYGVEIPLRTKLEEFISNQTLKKKGVGIKIPVVCVVLEGGPGTLDTIHNAITNGTPCVIVEGSGRIADVIAHVANLPISKITISLIQKQLKIFFTEEFDKFTQEKIIEWTKKIQDIVRMQQLLTVFRVDKEGQQDIDIAILRALLKASKSHEYPGHEDWDHQLKLAVAWNRVDIAKSEIFTGEKQWKSSDLHEVMTAALIGDKPEFAKLFMDQGVSLKEYLNQKTLISLYNNLSPSSLIYNKILKLMEEKPQQPMLPEQHMIQLYHISDILRELLGEFTELLYPRPKDMEKNFGPLSAPQIRLNTLHTELSQPDHRKSSISTKNDGVPEDPVRDLFLWAILQDRKELSDMFWEQSRDCIAAALGASKILKKLSSEEEDTDRSEEMQALADEYEERAIRVFTECYRKDDERSEKLLTRISEAWGKTTCLRLALEADNKTFLAQGGVQAFLTKVWWGKLSVDTKRWQLMLCMLLFPLIFTGLITFSSKGQELKLKQMNCGERLKGFFSSPVVIFYWNVLSYFGFLWLFAYVIMVDFQTTPSWKECLLYFWIASLVSEEIRQLVYDPDGLGHYKKSTIYIKDFWNKMDVFAILVFIIGLICRLMTRTVYEGRIILSLDFIIFCLRLIHIFTVSKTLGPKIIIVKKMMKDVFFFLFLLAVWLVAYGVAKQAILIHNEERLDWIFRGVVYQSYLTVFGEIPSDIDGTTFDLESCTVNGTDPYKPKCQEHRNGLPIFPDWLTILLMCVYLLFANILLLNLLIAMLSYTFEQIQENTDKIWMFQRHDLIEEYHGRPAAPPPFIIFNHIYLFVKHFILCRPPRRRKQFKEKLPKNEDAELLSWEAFMKENFLANLQHEVNQSTDQKIRDTSENVNSKLETPSPFSTRRMCDVTVPIKVRGKDKVPMLFQGLLQHTVGNFFRVNMMVEVLEINQKNTDGTIQQRLANLEEQLFQSAKALNWIMTVLSEKGFGPKDTAPLLTTEKLKETESKKADSEVKVEDQKSKYHVNARILLYPGSSVKCFPVPDEKVLWKVEFQGYAPPFYTSEKEDLTGSWAWEGPADPSSLEPSMAGDTQFNGESFHGPYIFENGLPQNPMGRTGLQGKGVLYWFGVNHAIDPVITRWRRKVDGSVKVKELKRMLEFLAVSCPSSKHWALPGGVLEPGETLPRKLTEILEEKALWAKFQILLNEGKEIYRGYVDDSRNTDNAWIETQAINVHFENTDDLIVAKLNSKTVVIACCSKEDGPVRWQPIEQNISIYANQKDFLQKVAELHDAHY